METQLEEKEVEGQEDESSLSLEGEQEDKGAPEPEEEEGISEELAGQKGEKEKEPSAQDSAALEKLVKEHPTYRELQGKFDRQAHLSKTERQELAQARELVKVARAQETEEWLQEHGDTPQNRNLIQELNTMREWRAQFDAEAPTYTLFKQTQACDELMSEHSLPESAREILMSSPTRVEMEAQAKALKIYLAKNPPPKGGQKPGAKTLNRVPALGHVPDKAIGSARGMTVESLQEKYISGGITWEKYEKEMRSLGKEP